MQAIIGYHFHNGKTLRDGRPLPAIGESLKHNGKIVMCLSGLHGSLLAIDAMQYAPGCWLDCCEFSGKIINGDDKLVAKVRTTLWRVNAIDAVLADARDSALSVAHLWKQYATKEQHDTIMLFLNGTAPYLSDDAARAAEAAAWAARAAARAAEASPKERESMFLKYVAECRRRQR